VLPEVDYLEAFRLKYWGKRDAWAWLVGIGAIFSLVEVVPMIGSVIVLVATRSAASIPNPLQFGLGILLLMAHGIIGVCFWLGKRWARLGLLSILILGALYGIVTEGPVGIGRAIVPIALAISWFRDTRNQLFFKIDVPREKLHKAWNMYSNNTIARSGFIVGILSVLMCPLAVIGLPCSLIGLRRVDPKAHPPVGRKGQAIAGIVLNSIGLIELAVFVAVFAFKSGPK